jgi:hypothetical protein
MTKRTKAKLMEELRQLRESLDKVSDNGIRQVIEKWIEQLQEKIRNA